MSFLSIEGYWRELLLALCKPIYKLIVYLYDLFEVIGTAEILTNETLSTIYNRIGMLLGIYMLFRILLSFIQMLINPDYVTDKEKGIANIAKKSLLVIVLLGITPFIFEKAMELQNYIVGVNSNENVIANLVLPGGSAYVSSNNSFGTELSAYLFESFYRYDEDLPEGSDSRNCEPLDKISVDSEITNLHNSIIWSNGDVSYAKKCLADVWTDENINEEKYKITFTSNGIFAVLAGLVVCYVLMMYTLMVGARVIQLAFLRIISPLAILGYLSPKKDGMFEKWLKMCTTTYVDLFIRMAIIYFVIFIVNALIGSSEGIALAKPYEHMWMVNVVMILALLMFAKKAPELLKELFPKSGVASLGFGLKSPKKIFDDMLFGSTINKGISSVGKKMRQAPANFAKQSMGRLDVLRHGGSLEEAKEKYPGFIKRGWHKWQKENAPLAYKEYENRVAGNQELADMHSNWIKGESLRQAIISKYSGRAGFDPDKWHGLFDGSDANEDVYDFVYKNKQFSNSARALDYEKEKMKAFGTIHTGLSADKDATLKTLLDSGKIKMEQADMVRAMMPGVADDKIDATAFYSTYEKQQKIVSSTEKTHESLRKVYSKDAAIEDQISFRKNNPNDPTGRR